MSEMIFSPGMRVRIRDAEWFVKRVAPVKTGGQALYVRGITCPVQGRDQIFWTEAERDPSGNIAIEEIRPENVRLALDTSSHAIRTRLRIESVVRHNPVSGGAIAVAHHAAMDVLNYQLQPAYHALNSARDPRSRILIADAVGLGKTLEAGVLLSELICRGAGKRILVVTLKSMMAQFQKEMWCRFAIPLVRLDSSGLQRIRSDIPSNHNPFNFYDKTIISVDTLKQDNQFKSALESAHWDVIVIDEAHNVSARGRNQRAQRARLAEKLATLCDHMILLSATPHDGSKESFASLMTLLDPLAIPNPSKYGPADIEGLYERRFKKDVADEIAAHFPERVLVPIEAEASLAESALYAAIKNVRLEMDSRRGKGDVMFRTTLIKSLLSSPAAFIETVKNRLGKLKPQIATDCHRYDGVDVATKSICGNLRQSAVEGTQRQSAVRPVSEWQWTTPLRTQLDRRQALVELDVIVTKALGLSLDDLLLMYRVSFPTMRKYDADTYYDQNGRCVFSAKSGESYLSRQEWESIKDMTEGEFKKTITETVFSDTPTERTITYKAPFFRKDREADYKEAWEMLEKRG